MKIGLVLDDTLDRPDGVQQYVITLGAWLAANDHEVHYLVGHTTRTDLKNVHSLARTMAVRFNKNRMSMPLPASTSRIRALLAAEKFDVLHVQMPYSPMMAARVIAAAPTTTAVIGTFHILPYQKLHTAATRALATAVRRTAKRFDAVVGVSAPAARFAEETFKVPATVLPNTVDIARFRAGRRYKRYDSSKTTLVFLGRLVERKGALQFIRAVAALPAEIKAVIRVVICGGGPLMQKYQEETARLGLTKTIEFTDYINEADKPSYLASADIAVFPSLGGEAFGIVLVEAMAAGAGVVLGGNNPGYSSVLAERPEQIFNPRDTKSFAAKLEHFITNKKARLKAYEWQQKAAAQYDPSVVGANMLAIYAKALRHRKNLR